jgi:hypothetical protein
MDGFVWAKRAIVTLAVVIGVVLLWRGLVMLAAAIAALVVGTYVGDRWRKRRSVRCFRAVWQVQGRDLPLVALARRS